MRQGVWIFWSLAVLSGCATIPPVPIPVPPLPVVEEPMEVARQPAPPMPAEERHMLMDSEPAWIEGPPMQVTMKAQKLATMKPALAGFDRGMLVYPYRPYAVYWADVPIQGALHLQFQPGEVIRLIAGLREVQWLVQQTDATTPLEVSHVTITPLDHPITGRATVITSWGVYYLDLHSQDAVGLYGVSWRHPAPVVR